MHDLTVARLLSNGVRDGRTLQGGDDMEHVEILPDESEHPTLRFAKGEQANVLAKGLFGIGGHSAISSRMEETPESLHSLRNCGGYPQVERISCSLKGRRNRHGPAPGLPTAMGRIGTL